MIFFKRVLEEFSEGKVVFLRAATDTTDYSHAKRYI